MAKPGPVAGSEGARKIAEAHRGSHDHDQQGVRAAVSIRQHISIVSILAGHSPEFPIEVTDLRVVGPEEAIVNTHWRAVEFEHMDRAIDHDIATEIDCLMVVQVRQVLDGW